MQEMQVQSTFQEDSLEEEWKPTQEFLPWTVDSVHCPMQNGAQQATVYGATKESDTI